MGPLAGLPARLEAGAAAARTDVGVAGKKHAARCLDTDVGGGLSHFGRGKRRGNVKMSTGFDVDGDRMTLNPRPLGMWQLVDQGSSKTSWFIPRKKAFTKKRKIKKGAHPIAYRGRVRWWVEHGPTRGHGTWERTRELTVASARPLTVDAVRKAVHGG